MPGIHMIHCSRRILMKNDQHATLSEWDLKTTGGMPVFIEIAGL